jgi:hypothetical protein
LAHSYHDAETYGEKALHKTRNHALFLSVLFLVFALFIIALCQPNDVSIASKAASYLAASYNSTLNLCPLVYGDSELGNKYYICSDNLLAYYALQNYNKTISDEIKAEIIEYAANYSLPTTSEGLPISYKHESVIGEVLPSYFHDANDYYLVNASDYTVITEINNGTLTSTWEDYADLLAYRGLSLINEGNGGEAKVLYDAMNSTWDGYGFADAAFKADETKTYQAYKLALAIILRTRLGLPKPAIENNMTEIIKICQQENGGIVTGYYRDLQTGGHLANTETTALVIIAESPIPDNVILLLEIAVSVTAIVIIAIAAKIITKRVKRKF